MAEVIVILPNGTRLDNNNLGGQLGEGMTIAQIAEELGIKSIVWGEPIRILPQDIPEESVIRVSGIGLIFNLRGR